MNRLLVLTMLSVLAIGATGCECCPPRKPQCRPACMPAAQPCCTEGSYATPGMITTGPAMVAPPTYAPQVIPGPAAYVPAQ